MYTQLAEDLALDRMIGHPYVKELLETGRFRFDYQKKQKELSIVQEQDRYQLIFHTRYSEGEQEIILWTKHPSQRLEVITGHQKNPNEQIISIVKEIIKNEEIYQYVKPFSSPEALAHTEVDYEKIGFDFPFEGYIIDAEFFQIYDKVPIDIQREILRLEHRFRDSMIFKYRKEFEVRTKKSIHNLAFDWQTYTFWMDFYKPNLESIKVFYSLLEEKKDEYLAYYRNLREIYLTRNVLISFLEKKNIPDKEKVIQTLKDITTPFD